MIARVKRGRRMVATGTILGLLALAASPVAAQAAAPPLLWQAPANGERGAGAGQFSTAEAIATDPTTGDVFEVDFQQNWRVSKFTVWGEFVEAFGWGVADGTSEELQSCGPGATPPTLECFAGIGRHGAGPGQIHNTRGIAVDSNGDVYVNEAERSTGGTDEGQPLVQNFRVQKFDSDGRFLLMFGGEVDKTKVEEREAEEANSEPVTITEAEENLCTAASGDHCGIGTLGGGQGQFSDRIEGNYIATGPGNTIYVGDVGRIQEFNADGTYKGEVQVPGKTVTSLAVDSLGNLYAGFFDEEDIHKISPAGIELTKFTVPNPKAVTVDVTTGDVYVIVRLAVPAAQRVVAFSSTGSKLIPDREEEERLELDEEERHSSKDLAQWGDFAEAGYGGNRDGLALGEACGLPAPDLYVTSSNREGDTLFNPEGANENNLRSYGPTPDPDLCAPPKVPPTITTQFATVAEPEEAVVRAAINPHFWSDAGYHVEYGVGKCSEGDCVKSAPVPAASLGSAAGTPLKVTVILPGLQPATTYHFRFVAESGGGGPAFGPAEVGHEASFAEGKEASFTTPAIRTTVADDCPNTALRTGLSAFLPDCRAYEMVSPVDKGDGDAVALLSPQADIAAVDQGSSTGDALTYSSYKAFAGAKSAPYSSQYLASREPGIGWVNKAISAPRGLSILNAPGDILETEYRIFSPDLCGGWLVHDSDPPLAAKAIEHFPNLYRQEECGEGGYEALTTVKPPNVQPAGYSPELQGLSANGSRAVFRVDDKLTGNANPASTSGQPTKRQCYEASEGKLRLISLLPDGEASKETCSVGTANSSVPNRRASVSHAVSDDGERVFWTQSGATSGPGQIYLRLNANQAPGQCSEAGKGCTVAVSEAGEALSGVSGSQFWAAAADGSRAIYTVGNYQHGEADLYEFGVGEGTTTLIAHDVEGLLGVSEDANRIYLVSEAVLTGSRANGQGAVARPGELNIYFYEAGAAGGFSFIGSLSEDDVPHGTNATGALSPVSPEPIKHTARVSADGLRMAFMSAARLTGFDNTDAATGKADNEVYLYDVEPGAGVGKLNCVSCSPTGVSPVGRELVVEEGGTGAWAAALLPPWENQLYAPRALSDNGRRLFFDSFQSLVPRDTNGKEDVYEWEAAGEGSCSEESQSFSPPNGGCLNLISSGESQQDSQFVDAGSEGRDVFFTTGQGLLPQDPGLIDIYDAREEGGFPPSPPATEPCQGEACQGPASPPAFSTPASSAFEGPGNQLQKPRPRRHCAKGAVRRQGRCVTKKHRHKFGKHHHRRRKAKKRRRNRGADTDRRVSR